MDKIGKNIFKGVILNKVGRENRWGPTLFWGLVLFSPAFRKFILICIVIFAVLVLLLPEKQQPDKKIDSTSSANVVTAAAGEAGNISEGKATVPVIESPTGLTGVAAISDGATADSPAGFRSDPVVATEIQKADYLAKYQVVVLRLEQENQYDGNDELVRCRNGIPRKKLKDQSEELLWDRLLREFAGDEIKAARQLLLSQCQ